MLMKLSPRGFVENVLHDVADGFTLWQNLSQGFGSQHVTKWSGDQQVCGVGVVAHVTHGSQRIRDLKGTTLDNPYLMEN
jgi:hypothetical protein